MRSVVGSVVRAHPDPHSPCRVVLTSENMKLQHWDSTGGGGCCRLGGLRAEGDSDGGDKGDQDP